MTSFNGEAIVYDAQGNPTEYLGHNLTWEKGRQLKSFDYNTYSYNANGIRTSKTVDCYELHEYVLEGSKILKETWNGNTLVPLYDNTDSVCGIIYNGISYFFLKNLQGDIIAITNSDGDTVAKYSYDAWGKCIIEYDSTGYIANINPFRYRGYYFDNETNLYYLNSRYYDANTGRFINVDSPEYVSIQGGNLFAYGGNCPTKNADYFGFCYVPTYPETYIPSYSSPSYSYGNKKKKEDGILITFLKVIGMMGLVVAAFGVGILNSLADLQEKYPKLETVVMILDAICTVGKFFFAPLGIAEIVLEVIGVLLTISKRNKTTEDWIGIIWDIVKEIFDIKLLETFGKFLKRKYDKLIGYLYVL